MITAAMKKNSTLTDRALEDLILNATRLTERVKDAMERLDLHYELTMINRGYTTTKRGLQIAQELILDWREVRNDFNKR